MNQQELNAILAKHRKWLFSKEGGEKANLSDTCLIDADLTYANLRYANLRYANLKGANLEGANLSFAELSCANLCGANLTGANLSDANLKNVKHNARTAFFAMQCPEVGSFTAFKKCGNFVVELLVPKNAKRSSATSRKCRTDRAKVIAIYSRDKYIINLKEIESDYDQNFVYKVGKTVKVKDFDLNRWNECSTGIHFFMSFEEVILY